MKELTIISGKGGTGKTTITAAFATLAENVVLADCDVDAADLHLILEPKELSSSDFIGGRAPVLDPEKCIGCNTCAELCRFDAIATADSDNQTITINEFACDCCGLCALACPEDAITMQECVNGRWFIAETRAGKMVHAKLGIGEDNSGKLVTLVRRQARFIAELEKQELLINDGPPGIGCPVTAAITGVDLVLIVTEPTLSGIHDMERVHGLCQHFEIPALVCVNRFDLNLVNTGKIRDYCTEHDLPLIGEIPLDPIVNRAQVARKSVVEYDCGLISRVVREMWEKVGNELWK
ncbi:MAG: (4Fe-4S)-binding protein [Deltaproteobacteria bacterium]|nr:(4Fe-4S)-binding protein [Deltaproteobacteria bacterium]